MVRLSVNINKIALIRNARGSNLPDLNKVALDCERYGADGITIHPRPDQRHIRYTDIPKLKAVLQTELNIEGFPSNEFLDIVCKNKPAQCTLVPDPPGVLTSNEGWNTMEQCHFLEKVIHQLQQEGIRVSLFVDPNEQMVRGAKETGADRIELFTGKYAHQYSIDPVKAIDPFLKCAIIANELSLGINAGHDLNLQNLSFFNKNIDGLLEVSIGHALICDTLYYGLENTIAMYKSKLV